MVVARLLVRPCTQRARTISMNVNCTDYRVRARYTLNAIPTHSEASQLVYSCCRRRLCWTKVELIFSLDFSARAVGCIHAGIYKNRSLWFYSGAFMSEQALLVLQPRCVSLFHFDSMYRKWFNVFGPNRELSIIQLSRIRITNTTITSILRLTPPIFLFVSILFYSRCKYPFIIFITSTDSDFFFLIKFQ